MKKGSAHGSPNRKLLLLISLFVFALLFRVILLNRIPNAIDGDELLYVLTGKAIALTGHDLTGSWKPQDLLTFVYPPGEHQAELPYFLGLPLALFTKFSLFTARFTNACISALTVLVIFGIAKKLFGGKTAIIAALVASVNPWLVYIGRTAYDIVPSTFFYCLGFLILLTQTRKRLLSAIPIFFLAFYSYIGTKVILIPFVLITSFYSWFVIRGKKDGAYFLAVNLSVLLLTAFFAFSIFQGQKTRTGDLFLPGGDVIVREVDAVRKTTIATPFTELFDNKGSVYVRTLVQKTFSTLSPDYLFTKGDTFFPVYGQGLFHPVDAVFLVIGFGALFFFNIKALILFVLLSCVTIAPQLLFYLPDLFSPHISLLIPMFVLVTAVGIHACLSRFPRSRSFPIMICIICFYCLGVFHFSYTYLYQHPMQGHFDFSVRILARYIDLSKTSTGQIFVQSNHSKDLYKKYLFYTNAYSKETSGEVQKSLIEETYTLGNVHFISCDDKRNPENNPTDILINDANCAPPKSGTSYVSIKQLKDAGNSYVIYHDPICGSESLSHYPSGITLSDFAVESMPKGLFCSTYIFIPS